MKNYVFIYFNNGIREDVAPEAFQAEWQAFFGGLGDKLVDVGNPFGPGGMSVQKSGVSNIEKGAATGYSIVKVGSIDEAVELAKSCPVLNEPEGAVRVYETMPM